MCVVRFIPLPTHCGTMRSWVKVPPKYYTAQLAGQKGRTECSGVCVRFDKPLLFERAFRKPCPLFHPDSIFILLYLHNVTNHTIYGSPGRPKPFMAPHFHGGQRVRTDKYLAITIRGRAKWRPAVVETIALSRTLFSAYCNCVALHEQLAEGSMLFSLKGAAY